MKIIPAIDLLDGKVIRLYQGKKESVTVYSDNPLEIACQWIREGAGTLHVVDLSASFGEGDNLEVIRKLAGLGIQIQVGGGIRSLQRGEELLNMGVNRVIVGTKATDEDFLKTFIKEFKEKVAVGVDIFEGKMRCEGWCKETDLNFLDFVKSLIDEGVKWIIYTDISRDGTLKGPGMENIKKLAFLKGPNYIVSGGIATIEDLKLIKEKTPFIYGIITGKALYEKKINLREALSLIE